jgi:Reverse transcriptase (RNA-dependent DNA polymerase)
MRSYLTARTHTASFSGRQSRSDIVHCGIPQGSVLGPLLFILYTGDVEKLARSLGLSVHLYADDTLLFCSGKPTNTADLKLRTVHAAHQVAQWMASNKLRLNASKTECMWCAAARRQHLIDHTPVDLNDVSIIPSSSVRDLGVLLSTDMSVNSHVNKIVSECFYKLRQLKSRRRCLPTPVAESLINCFVVSKVDYCNALLAGQPDYIVCRLQSVLKLLNAATRLIFGPCKFDHITEISRDRLQWLQVGERVDVKFCLLVYKAQQGLAADYVAAICEPVSSVAVRPDCGLLRLVI